MTYVNELMSKDVVTINEDSTAYDVAKIMDEKNIGTIVIVKNEEPIGIVTERDLVKRICSKDLKSSSVKVKDIMSSPLITVQPNAPIGLAASLMVEHNIRRLPVIKNNKLVGIITSRNIIRELEGWIEAP
ncbi:MAG: CBS domain-containing protein [Candidatus Nitrosocaldaceae archaeon]